MMAIWDQLSPALQNWALLVLLSLPALVIGAVVLRGFAPWPLVQAMIWRFRWTNALFVLLIAISVGIGIGLLAQERGLRRGTAQAADKFDLIIAAPGSELTMMMASVYLQPTNVPLLDGALFHEIITHDHVDIAAPLAFGDSYQGAPVVGTTAEFARYLSEDQIAGRIFETSQEAIAGAHVSLALGDQFVPAHGVGDAAEDGVHETALTVVGRMSVTGTPWDKSILVPVESVWETHGLANGHRYEDGDRIGPPFDPEYFPGTPAIIVRAKALWANYALRSEFTRAGESMAFFPGAVLTRLYGVLGDMRQAMSAMALVTQGLVAASVLVGLLLLVGRFQRQMALLRALGAPNRFIFAVIWSYAAFLMVIGAVLGLMVGQGATIILSRILTARTDILIEAPLAWPEFHFVAGFVTLASLLALGPAAILTRKPIVTTLRS